MRVAIVDVDNDPIVLINPEIIAESGSERAEEGCLSIPDIYGDVDRSAVVWVVSASDPLSFQPRTWTFPVVGSVPYLGWFNRDDARAFADELKGQGYDVDLRGADAYSTLGWFEDPILSTMVGEGV